MKLHPFLLGAILVLQSVPALSQFIDHFDSNSKSNDWQVATGDGQAKIVLTQNEGIATATVDATSDELNIWWAIVRCPVSGLDMKQLAKQEAELRVEARVKVSHAPRRINLSFNHQRTTDFHSNLKEYDLADTSNWHVISMTTRNFEVQEGDQVNVQMALMDWGPNIYSVKIDYLKVDVVASKSAKPDLGNPLDYHPSVPDLARFSEKVRVAADATIDQTFPDRNFNHWQSPLAPQRALMSVNHQQRVIMRFDLSAYAQQEPAGVGVLELPLHHLERSPDFTKDFGIIRVVEIVGGPGEWADETVTYEEFMQGDSPVVNGQMIIDVDPAQTRDGSVLCTLSAPVLKRLLTGKTKGLALLPLGAVHASFLSRENPDASLQPTLHFNVYE